jgi:hypothetical protein
MKATGSPRVIALALAALSLAASATRAAEIPTVLKLWPGYSIELPAGHCVQIDRGPDFDVLYFRGGATEKDPVLIGLYTGFAPREPECPKPVTKEWDANDLSFKSVRGGDGCAEFGVKDPKKPERGYLHLWYGPGAKDHAQLAEGVLASIRPIPKTDRPDDLPKCK